MPIVNDESTQSQLPATVGTSSPSSIPANHSATTRSSPIKTVQEVDISFDLTKLYDSEKTNSPIVVQSTGEKANSSSTLDRMSQDSSQSRRKRDASFVGESWYASLLLRASNNENNKLQQHLDDGSQSTASIEQYSEAQSNTDPNDSSWQEIVSNGLPSGLPRQDLVISLIQAYFTRFHVLFPIMNQSQFLSSFADGSISIPLLRCVLFVASVHCDADIIHRMGYSTRADAGDHLFNQAKNSIDAHPGEN